MKERYTIPHEYLDQLGPAQLPPDGGVYFLQCAGFIKIGFAWSVRQRWLGIQTSCPLAIVPLGYVHFDRPEDAEAYELDLHRQFAASRHRGEWFHSSEELRAVIQQRCQSWPIAGQRGGRRRNR